MKSAGFGYLIFETEESAKQALKIYDNSKQPIISTHPAYIKMKSDLINSNKNGIIFVIRNPLDLCISQYYFYESSLQSSFPYS